MKIDRQSLVTTAETWGAGLGIAGALLLALSLPQSRWGWVLFLGSNVAWLVFSGAFGHRKLFLQTTVFTATSLLGIANNFFPGNPLQTAMLQLAHVL